MFTNLEGKNVEIYVSSYQQSWHVERGIVSDISRGAGENGVFIGLDNGTMINVRYIIKIVVK